MHLALKTRLIGALVLIALAVIVVPLFFPAKPPASGGAQNISLDIPPPPDQQLQTRTLSVAPPTGASTQAPANSNQSLARVDIPSRVPASVTPDASDAGTDADHVHAKATTAPPPAAPGVAAKTVETTPKPAPKPAPKPTTPTKDKAATSQPGRAAHTRYVISLGAYTDKHNAQRLLAKAQGMRYPVKLSAVQIGGKPAARVDVGPFDSRAAAEAARLKLHAAMPQAAAKLHTATTDQKADAPATALAAGRAGGWAVQVVAYSKKVDAEKLRDRLRKAGFDSYVDDVTASGATLWRVRVGPAAKRREATELRDRLKTKFPKLHGVVVTVP